MSATEDSMKRDANGNTAPQYYNADSDDYEFLRGTGGGIFVVPVGRSSHVAVEVIAGTSETSAPFAVSHIILISNDGADDVRINFDANTSAAGTLTIKAGEAFMDIPRKCSTLYYKAASGNPAIRVWGV